MSSTYFRGLRLFSTVRGLPAALYVAFIGFPLIALLVRSLGEDGFFDSITSETALSALQLSLWTSAIAVAVVVLIGTPFAYTLARWRFPGVQILNILVELPIVLPPVVAGLAMLMAFGRAGMIGQWLTGLGVAIPFTTIAVVLAQMFVAAPFYIRSAKLGFQSVSRDYEEISHTLGISPWLTFWRITLPLAWPALVSGLALAWARAVAEFGATIMFAGNFPGKTQTMPLAILSAMESDLSDALAMAVLLATVSLTILVILAAVSGFQRRSLT